MRDLWDFVKQFYCMWVPRFTGGALGVFLIVWAFCEKRLPPLKILWIAVAFYYFISAFLIWRAAHHRAITAEAAIEALKTQAKADSFGRARLDALREKFDSLQGWQKSILHQLLTLGAMYEHDAARWLENKKIIKIDQPLAMVNHETTWLCREPTGTYTVLPMFERDLKQILSQ